MRVEGELGRVIFTDECKVMIGESNRVYVWRRPGEDWMPDCSCPGPPVRVSLMNWACITWNGVVTTCVVDGNINAQKYMDILESILFFKMTMLQLIVPGLWLTLSTNKFDVLASAITRLYYHWKLLVVIEKYIKATNLKHQQNDWPRTRNPPYLDSHPHHLHTKLVSFYSKTSV